jgi:hypothetical protein
MHCITYLALCQACALSGLPLALVVTIEQKPDAPLCYLPARPAGRHGPETLFWRSLGGRPRTLGEDRRRPRRRPRRVFQGRRLPVPRGRVGRGFAFISVCPESQGRQTGEPKGNIRENARDGRSCQKK